MGRMLDDKMKELLSIPTVDTDDQQSCLQGHGDTECCSVEHIKHSRFMEEALNMGRLALRINETPVGCVLVYKDHIIAKGMNATNVTRCGIRHAEYMALGALLSYQPSASCHQPVKDPQVWTEVDPTNGHLWPYGQKLHPSPIVDPAITKECVLYVTVEPCIMCASMLRQFGIKKVYFGAVNDKFGGTGGVLRIHQNSSPSPPDGALNAPPILVDPDTEGVTVLPPTSLNIQQSGDGGNVEPGYEVEGGWGRDEAVALLRRFYVQENGRAPVPRKKDGRAARLAAMMDKSPAAEASEPTGPEELQDCT